MLAPSWEPRIRILVVGGFIVAFVSNAFYRLDRVEGKLDAILEKLNKRMSGVTWQSKGRIFPMIEIPNRSKFFGIVTDEGRRIQRDGEER
jgi:hypothetical protein